MKRLIAIGDIHGCYYTLKSLIDKLNINKETDILIFTGDYIDRGKYSYEVLEYLRKLQKEINCICLLGNHEDMTINALESNDKQLWKMNGGTKTITSYYRNNKLLKTHLNWLKSLPLYYETDKYIFCHAGLPKTLLKDNSKNDMLWDIDWIFNKAEPNEKQVIFGHYQNEKVFKTINGNIGIDTGCWYGGKLSALVIENEVNFSIFDVEKDKRD